MTCKHRNLDDLKRDGGAYARGGSTITVSQAHWPRMVGGLLLQDVFMLVACYAQANIGENKRTIN